MDRKEIIESGLLELYVMGSLKDEELLFVERALSADPSLGKELEQIEHTLLQLAEAQAIAPNPTLKLLLMAKIDYMQRLGQGEIPDPVPQLNEHSKVEDFQQWLDRPDLQAPEDLGQGHVAIISQDAEKVTAIVWLTLGAPPETHGTEYEKFLIVEGSCDITIETDVHHLKAGSYLSIPLHLSHHVMVTSQIPCKIILQRVGA
jgi:mannose-6-phosphate isomerase-like protein (cupin superfamily)